MLGPPFVTAPTVPGVRLQLSRKRVATKRSICKRSSLVLWCDLVPTSARGLDVRSIRIDRAPCRIEGSLIHAKPCDRREAVATTAGHGSTNGLFRRANRITALAPTAQSITCPRQHRPLRTGRASQKLEAPARHLRTYGHFAAAGRVSDGPEGAQSGKAVGEW